jgi:hypothetical protein
MTEYMERDIETYLNSEVKNRIALGSLKFKQQSLLPEIVCALKKKADGM